MTLAIVYSRASSGISAPLVTVEVHLSVGMPGLHIVGLPETEVKESKDRVRSALLNANFEFPARRITINLAPADLPKEGGRFDLPIALGILAASGQLPIEKLKEYEFCGELALSGEIRPVKGILPFVLSAQAAERKLVIPKGNAIEAGFVQKAQVFSASHLLEVSGYLKEEITLESNSVFVPEVGVDNEFDISDVKGQSQAKKSLEIAAAGKHSLLLMGPPGTGKTMLANRLMSLLPPLTDQQALEVAAVLSISSGGFNEKAWKKLPFRSPHHSSSSIALVGGGRPPRPGEISLAHHGILFLDELPEFNRHALESLREPLESGLITISRAATQAIFPAKFQLVAAMNPCPCGFAGHASGNCRCTSDQIQRYLHKLSGPLLDRIDMQIEVPSLSAEVLNQGHKGETSEVIKQRVIKCRTRQVLRQQKFNSELTIPEMALFCELEKESKALLNEVMLKFDWSARTYHRILRLARTIADLYECDKIDIEHLSQALTYRCLDKLKRL